MIDPFSLTYNVGLFCAAYFIGWSVDTLRRKFRRDPDEEFAFLVYPERTMGEKNGEA